MVIGDEEGLIALPVEEAANWLYDKREQEFFEDEEEEA